MSLIMKEDNMSFPVSTEDISRQNPRAGAENHGIAREKTAVERDKDSKLRKRAGYIDIARGIAIILVVVHHTGKLWSPFDNFYTLFFMPLFIFISFASFKKSFFTILRKSRKIIPEKVELCKIF